MNNKAFIVLGSVGMTGGAACVTVGALVLNGKIAVAMLGLSSVALGSACLGLGILLMLISTGLLLKYFSSRENSGDKKTLNPEVLPSEQDVDSALLTASGDGLMPAEQPSNTVPASSSSSPLKDEDSVLASEADSLSSSGASSSSLDSLESFTVETSLIASQERSGIDQALMDGFASHAQAINKPIAPKALFTSGMLSEVEVDELLQGRNVSLMDSSHDQMGWMEKISLMFGYTGA